MLPSFDSTPGILLLWHYLNVLTKIYNIVDKGHLWRIIFLDAEQTVDTVSCSNHCTSYVHSEKLIMQFGVSVEAGGRACTFKGIDGMTARAPQSSVPPPYLYCIKDTLNVCFLSGTFLHAVDNVALFRGVSKSSTEYFPIK